MLLGLDYKRYTYRDYAASNDMTDDDFNIFDPAYGYPVGEMTPYTDTDTTQSQVGLYAQDQIKLGNWQLTLGGCQDWADAKVHDNLAGAFGPRQKDDAFTSRAGLLYLADNGLAPYVSYSESFQPVSGPDSNGNPLVPETGKQYEVGLKYQPVGWNAFVTVSAFDLARQECRTLWRCWRAQRQLPDRRDQVARHRAGSCCEPRFRLRFPGGLYISRHRDHQGHLDHRR
ncbi:TonB-dependent receptor [Mesorhizobium sp.]|uniref:TonB-dependent siderophore receptor n=1 Tax=Mesorhizobium sp. TaxID=1871066 RepID=UPI00257E29F5|nr:TonB-dependent receptor [Mesorhizobium sp.]